MSQMVDGPRKTFIASEAAGANLRWYISDPTTSPGTVSLCDAVTPAIGVNEDAVLAIGDRVTLLLSNASGTRKMVATGAVTGGNQTFAAAGGKVASSGTILEGTAFQSVTTLNDILEVMATFGEDVDEDWADDEVLEFGTGDDVNMLWSTGDASNHCVVIGIGDTSQQIHITDKGARATDWNRTAGTHPELAIHSNTTPATDYLAMGNHDGTTATIDVVGGTTLSLAIAGVSLVTVTATGISLVVDDDCYFAGASADCGFGFMDADASNHTMVIFTDDTSQQIHITDKAAKDTDWIRTAGTHPELAIHSNTTPATDYLAIGNHDGTVCWLGNVIGGTTAYIGFDGLECVEFTETGSAVNHVGIANAATGGAPAITATGDDTHVSLELSAKGTTGVVQVTDPLVEKMTLAATADTATITIAQLLTKILDATPTAAATYTLPTAANLVAGITDCKVGDSFRFIINNKGGAGDDITVAGGAGSTDDGILVVADGEIREFIIVVTNVTGASEAYLTYGIGTPAS